jgi:hypothetical protein
MYYGCFAFTEKFLSLNLRAGNTKKAMLPELS